MKTILIILLTLSSIAVNGQLNIKYLSKPVETKVGTWRHISGDANETLTFSDCESKLDRVITFTKHDFNQFRDVIIGGFNTPMQQNIVISSPVWEMYCEYSTSRKYVAITYYNKTSKVTSYAQRLTQDLFKKLTK